MSLPSTDGEAGALKAFERPCLLPKVTWPGVGKPGLRIHGGRHLSQNSFGGLQKDGEGRMDETENSWNCGPLAGDARPEAEPPRKRQAADSQVQPHVRSALSIFHYEMTK